MKNECDYVVCLNENGSITHVHRDKLTRYCKSNEVEFLLIPLSDTRQYVIYQSPIKKFKECHISFSAYMTSYDDEDSTPIYEHVYDYDIHCRDMVDFARFIQSMIVLHTIPEMFIVSNDEFLNSFDIIIESAYIEYSKTDGNLISDRLKDTSGTVKSSFTIPEFIDGVEHTVCGSRTSQYMLHPDDMESRTIIINSSKSTWSFEYVDVDNPDDILPGMTKKKYLFGVFSKYTNTLAFIPYRHLITLELVSGMEINICACSPLTYIGEKGEYKLKQSTLFDYLCENNGYGIAESQLTINNICDGDLSDLFELFYDAHLVRTSITDIIMFAINCERVLDIYTMYNKVIHGDIIDYLVFQISAKVRFENKEVYSVLCEDLDMMSRHETSLYDRFINETSSFLEDELPERYVNCRMEFLQSLPTRFPF